jgi:NTE family protein
VPKISLEVLDVSFEAIREAKAHDYFMNLPTSFALPAEAVDRLRDVAGRLLRQAIGSGEVLRDIAGDLAP